ncbi:response regulator receiver protein [Leptolyngbya sp. Heron Island J]|uniref:response regulator n=1 Tax=Leptolyngbya sp. Heron Island J TaxID=1385935 RepID=UPI0003B96071|nr:response regulator [Leptolyngbya sp. Heron Island J]ESA32567.1 response regulator receiver protein [Leptolyngbya sp. Heron Island J]
MARILLVEDNELNRDMLSRRLRRRGYDLAVAVDGAEAIAIASAQPFDLILMDMSLPVIDGWEATRRLKAQPHTQQVPIIALTAHAMRGDRDQALAAGCDDYDTKPIDLKRLLSKIKAFLAKDQLATSTDSSKTTTVSETKAAPVIPISSVTPITPPAASVAPISPIVPTVPVTPLTSPAAFVTPLDSDTPITTDTSNAPGTPLGSVTPITADPADTSVSSEQFTPITADVSVPPIAPVTPISSDVSVVPPVTPAASTAPADNSSTPSPDKPNNIFSGLPILVVDDNEDNRDMLSRRLNRRGYQSVVVDSGEAALDYIQHNKNVALVLLDIMMPGIDGIETLKRIRQTYSRNQLPVLMVTAKAQSDDMVKAFELGANDYITKPIDFAVTLARVETQLAIVKATQQPVEPVNSNQLDQPAETTSQTVKAANSPKAGTQSAVANISLVPKTTFSRFAAQRYQVQYFLRQEPLGPISIALDKQTDSLVLLQTLKAYSPDTAELLKQVMEKETEKFEALRSLFPGYTYGQVDNTFYIIHGLGETFNQEQLLQAKLQTPWQLESVLLLMDRLLEQVGIFHRHNQVHAGLRDDSFIQTHGRENSGQSMVLVDSGLGKRVMIGVSQQSAEYRKQLLMQRDYQPLEQRIGRPAMSSDVYALGLIGLQALTGQSIDRLTLPTVSGDLPWRQFASVGEPIGEWFDKLIQQNQGKRFEHAMAARAALRPHLQPYLAEPG